MLTVPLNLQFFSPVADLVTIFLILFRTFYVLFIRLTHSTMEYVANMLILLAMICSAVAVSYNRFIQLNKTEVDYNIHNDGE